MLSNFSYIILPDFTGDIKANIQSLFNANNKAKTFEHSKAVADMNMKIAGQYGLDLHICGLCGYLHDISAVIARDDMLSYAVENNWHIDEAERRFPVILHQRISKLIAEQDFGITDRQILSAVECHTTLRINPSVYDMALFIADKLAWDLGHPPFYGIVKSALDISLESASLAYMDYIVKNKMILYPHKWFEKSMEFLHNVVNTNRI